MKTIDFSYYIEKYIAGEMSNTERRWFENELEGNDKLRAEVDLRRRTDSILKDKDLLSLKGKLAAIEKEVYTPKKEQRKIGIRFIRYAAIAVVLIGLGSVAIKPLTRLSNDDIINKYYKAYEPPTVERSANAPANKLFTTALEYYNTHDYERAAIFFTKVIESNPTDMQSMLLNGVANFEISKYPDAKKSLNTVIDDNNNLFIDQAEWYLALCYIKTGETSKAKNQLEIIGDGDGVYRKDATKILRQLK